MLDVKIKLENGGKLPYKATEEAAAHDVYTRRIDPDFTEDGEVCKVTCYLGFATEILPCWKGEVVPRSNIAKHGWFMPNSKGVIDSDFRGEWRAVFWKSCFAGDFPYKEGDRVAQIYFDRVQPIDFKQVNELNETNRNSQGFGTTGVK